MGCNVITISDPPVRSRNTSVMQNISLWLLYEECLLEIYQSLGCTQINASREFDREKFSDEFYSTKVGPNGELDWIHGSNTYYLELCKIVLPMISVHAQPKYESTGVV